MSTVKIFLDDIRFPPDETWLIARNYNEAIMLIEENKDNHLILSLDHDLGEEKTGYDFCKYLESAFYTGQPFQIQQASIHSANPVGRKNMTAALKFLEHS